MYALKLDENARVIFATWPKFAKDGDVLVEEIPEGNIADYRYENGEFVYDPLPETPPEEQTMEERVMQLEEQNNMLMECLLEMSEIVYQ